ncbi:putative homocysteine S-methyltransferase [Triangularia verruculosa]|uniref:Homocysteine S-methyltransferase n=1 Tax=Triangularia verruculosa TaxID=2587418 RepID=A0AAN7AWK3_9PEZI|nr:putative homocysteine S-methyltransferase [Triangularia verruculosa]
MRGPVHVKILDGGLGTTLETNHGVKFSEATPLWSSHLLLTDQRTLLECQSSFAAAGAEIITTATYQVSIDGFRNTKTENWPSGVSLPNIGQFLEDAVLVAKMAAEESAGEVALSLGPYGATMIPSAEYTGRYDEDPLQAMTDKLYEWHNERFNLYAKVPGLLSGVSYIAFETIPRFDEILAIRRLLATRLMDFPVWISILFPGDDDKMPDGTSVEDAIASMISIEFGIFAPQFIGINCTRASKIGRLVRKFTKTVEGLVAMGAASGWPGLVLCPDGTREGEKYNTGTKEWETSGEGSGQEINSDTWEHQLASVVKEASTSGHWKLILVGGCCRTRPENIAKLHRVLEVEE